MPTNPIPSNGGDTGFKVIAQYGEPVETRKGTERVVIQSVSAGGQTWLELRVQFIGKSGRWTPTKQAITFSDAEQVESLLAALEVGSADAVARSVIAAARAPHTEAPPTEDAPEVVPVPPRKARHSAFGEDALIGGDGE